MAQNDGTAEVFVQRAKEALRSGNYLLCYDLVDQAQQLGVQSRRLQYLSLLALANAGSTAFAWRRYQELGLQDEELDEDWLALQGRLFKDLALAGGDRADFQRAAEAYLAAFRQTGGYFTAINAATMFLLAGEEERARQLAGEVLALAGGSAPAHEIDHYYLLATEAEAALLLGDERRCKQTLKAANRLARGDVNARSRTRAQLALICRHRGVEDKYSPLLGLPALFYLERSAEAIPISFSADRTALALADSLPAADCERAVVFAPLLQPSDLCAAEHLLERGAQLHLVLPAARKIMIERWQEGFGAGWSMRLARCLEQVGEITTTQGFLDSERAWAGRYVTAMAQGLARLTAQRLGDTCRSIELAPAPAAPGFRLSAAPVTAASPPATAQERGGERRLVGLIFADIAGFRRLRDEDMPRFWSQVMGGVAKLIEKCRDKVLFRHTWGDAINIITEDAATAAELAVAIQACIEEVRRSESGPMAELELRLAVHYAPAFTGFDPIENQPNYYGSQLSFTARIEPVTPPGMIFVTEAFAARVALEAPQRFAVEYAGEVELAKRFGKFRLYSLHSIERRRTQRKQAAAPSPA